MILAEGGNARRLNYSVGLAASFMKSPSVASRIGTNMAIQQLAAELTVRQRAGRPAHCDPMRSVFTSSGAMRLHTPTDQCSAVVLMKNAEEKNAVVGLGGTAPAVLSLTELRERSLPQ